MLTINEALVLQELAIFADTKNINKSKLGRDIGVTRTTIINIINKFKECKINVKG